MEPAIDFLPDGRVVVTLSRKNLFRVYAKDGKSGKNYKIGGGKTEPLGVAVDSNGKLWFSDKGTNRIHRVSVP